MILGFAYRSPDVVRLTLDRSKYACHVIPKYSDSSTHAKAYAEAVRQSPGNRKRVFLFSDCRGLAAITRDKVFDPKSTYIVFDSASILTAKSCIDIVDATASTNQAVWQYQKTMPSMMVKLFDKTAPGIDPKDIECLNSVNENPEDRIKTDIPKREATKKSTRLIDEIKAIAAKYPGVEFKPLLAMLLFGKFLPNDEVTEKKRNMSLIGLQTIGTYKSSSIVKLTRRFCKQAERIGLKIKPKHETKIAELFQHSEFPVALLGMIALSKGVSADKASADTGADPNILVWLRTGLETATLDKRISGKYQYAKSSFPLRIVKRRMAKTLQVEVARTYEKQRRTKIKHGSYSEESLLRELGLLRLGENLTIVKASTDSAVLRTNIPKYMSKTTQGILMYMVDPGTNYFVKFRGFRKILAGV